MVPSAPATFKGWVGYDKTTAKETLSVLEFCASDNRTFRWRDRLSGRWFCAKETMLLILKGKDCLNLGVLLSDRDRVGVGAQCYSCLNCGYVESFVKIPYSIPSEITAPVFSVRLFTHLKANCSGPGATIGMVEYCGILFVSALGAHKSLCTCVPSDTFIPISQYLLLLNIDGKIIQVGTLEDGIPSLDLSPLLVNQASLSGSLIGGRQEITDRVESTEPISV
ncbi:hypothetical protein V1508DRAFT_405934 [Lipomyces doorenjongii]|uniref:uncharacterized protein n=1 Tax=Lipomyces doorenjongii TaxID=383834 RepID=UPI0034CF62D6